MEAAETDSTTLEQQIQQRRPERNYLPTRGVFHCKRTEKSAGKQKIGLVQIITSMRKGLAEVGLASLSPGSLELPATAALGLLGRHE
jgi:hypothetical protein